MSVAALLAHHWRRHRLALVWLVAASALFQWAITRVVPAAEQTNAVRAVFALVPESVRVFFGEELLANVSARGFLGFGYVHPFALLMYAAWAVRVAAGSLAGEEGRGTMELLAARPVKRGSQVMAAAVALFAGLALVAVAEWAGTAWGLRTRGLENVPPADFVPLAAMSFLLFACLGAVALLVSALADEGGQAVSWCAGLFAGSYVLDYLARVWSAIGFLRPLSPFRYFEPQRILREGGIAAGDAAILLAVGAAALVLAFVSFSRRDL